MADYGYCWQPSVAVSNSNWRPYSDGYWAYTDVGWTWVSYEDFGWATYHYGRWTRLRDRGWFWVPGREWGPAWVSWRTGGDYVGWAPLPPRGRGEVDYDDRPISGQVDVEFDIGPAYYNFVDVRYIGEPVLRERIVEPNLNITYISNTVNVTNITYTNSVVYNHGPDYDTLSRYSTRPIRRMTLERDSNVELSVAAQVERSHQSARRQTYRCRAAHISETSQADRPENGEGENRQNRHSSMDGTAFRSEGSSGLEAKDEERGSQEYSSTEHQASRQTRKRPQPAGASPAAPASGTTPATARAPLPLPAIQRACQSGDAPDKQRRTSVWRTFAEPSRSVRPAASPA